MVQNTPQHTTSAVHGKKSSDNILEKKPWLGHLIAISTFLIINLIYFSPVIFHNKGIYQEDIMRARGTSKSISDFRAKYHEEPLWADALFCGMPAYLISTYYVASNLEYLNKVFSVFIPHPVRYIFLCCLGFYFLLQVLRVNSWLSIMGGLAFGLSSYFFICVDVGHNSKMAAIAYMAPVLAGIILTYRGKMWMGAAVTALFLSMEIFSNHPQITYYLAFIIFIYALSELYRAYSGKNIPAFLKQSGVLILAAVLALGVNITSLWATADYGQYTIRGGTELTINPNGSKNEHNTTSGLEKDYATAWSYGVGETYSLLIPNIKGGGSSPIGNNKTALKNVEPEKQETVSRMSQYFGDQPFTMGPVYVGAIVMFLFFLGLFIIKGTFKWALLICTLLSIWLSWGKNDPFGFSNFMLEHFPAYNKFRSVSMILVIAELTIPLLGILAIDSLIKNKNFLNEKFCLPFKQSISGKQSLLVAFILTGGLSLLCWLSPGLFTSFTASGERQELLMQIKQSNPEVDDQQINTYLDQILPSVETARKAIVQADALRSFIFILLAAGIIFLYTMNKVVNKTVLSISLIALVATDLLVIDKRYLNDESFHDKKDLENPTASMGRPYAADLEILKDTTPNYRVWNTMARPDQDGATSYFHKSISGYHGAKLRRYQDLIDFHINARNMSVINMLNTKYIIIPGEKNQPVAYPNAQALGNAWFVKEYKIVANADSEIVALRNFDPATTAIIDKRFEKAVDGFKTNLKDSLASIKLTNYKANHLTYESNSTTDGLAVFSEIYFAGGWNAYIDGNLTPHFRTDYVLRAMRIPAGKHQIEFKFEPKIISIGEKVSSASLALLFLLCAGAAFKEFKKNQ